MVNDNDATDIDAMVAQVQAGGREVYRDLVLAVQQDLRVWLAWRLGQAELVEEVLQATLVAAYEHLNEYECRGTFRAWVKGIARHRALRALRERQRDRARRADVLDQALIDCRLDALNADAEREEREVALDRLRACLAALSPAARRLVEQRYAAERSLDDLGRELGRTANALAARLFRIRASLQRCLQNDGGR